MKQPEATKEWEQGLIYADLTTVLDGGTEKPSSKKWESYQSKDAAVQGFGAGEKKRKQLSRKQKERRETATSRRVSAKKETAHKGRCQRMRENASAHCCFKCKLEESLIAPRTTKEARRKQRRG